MKKLITLLLFTVVSYGQNVQFSIGSDLRNAVIGSDPTGNKPAANLIYQFAMVSNKGIEVGITYETFKAISFDRYNIQVGYQINVLERLKVVPAFNYNIIGRYGSNWGNESSHLAFGANVGLRYKISDTFDVEYNGEVLQRVDLNTKYGGNNYIYSGYVKLIYKINL
jgi:hypothetical protein